MKTYGDTIKRIRVCKGLSQKVIAQGKIACSTISKIENSHISPSINTLETILSKVNMTLEEFIFIHNDYSLTPKEQLLSEFFNITAYSEQEEIKHLKANCAYFLKDKTSTTIIEIHELCSALELIAQQGDISSAQKKVLPIWTRLEKSDTFFMVDMQLLSHLLFLFPIDTAIHLTHQMLTLLVRYAKYSPYMQRLKITVLLNPIVLYGQSLVESEAMIERALTIAKKAKQFDLYAVALFKKGILKQNNSIISQAFSMLSNMGLDHINNQLLSELLSWTQKKKNN